MEDKSFSIEEITEMVVAAMKEVGHTGKSIGEMWKSLSQLSN